MNALVLDLASEAGRLHEAQLRHLFAPLSEALIILDERGRLLILNPAAERIFGFRSDEVTGGGLDTLFPAMPSGAVGPRADGADLVLPATGRRRDGVSLDLMLLVDEVRWAERALRRVIVRERETADTVHGEALQWARLDLLGRLAPSLAHELSQPLSALANLAQSCRQLVPGDGEDEPGSLLDEIVHQAARASQVVRAMRTFALKGESAQKPESVAALVGDARALGLCDAGCRRLRVETDIDPDLRVLADRVLVQQALVNLLRNAADAMAGSERRELRIVGRAQGDGWAEIRVEDSGPGVAPDLAGRIFSASRSTKPDGLGLGLSICRDIVEHHGGTIRLENRPPDGATFVLNLPRFIGVNAYA